MARIREKTLKFPGLDNTYTFADEADLFDANVDCAVGEYRIYAGDLYRCTVAHTGAWNASHFTAVKMGKEVSALQTDLDAVTQKNYGDNIFDGIWENGNIDNNGQETTTGSYQRTGYIPLDSTQAKLYFVRATQPYSLRLRFYSGTATNTYISRADAFTSNTTVLKNNVSIPSTAKYLRMVRDLSATGTVLSVYYSDHDSTEPYVEYTTLKDESVSEETLDPELQAKVNAKESLFDGKTIAFMGDSLVGNVYDETGICAILADLTGATVINCGFGGSRMAYRYGSNAQYTYWNALSGAGLATAIASGTWTSQDTAVANMTSALDYFADRLTAIKAIDWTKVDYIMWEYGTNDFMTEVSVSDSSDPTNMYAFENAYRYAIETIQTAYPNIQIIPITPIYRWYQENGVFTDDSDTHTQADYLKQIHTLPEFVSKVIEIAKDYKLPCIDDYYSLGANKNTRLEFFDSTDGTHPNADGRRKIAEHIAAESFYLNREDNATILSANNINIADWVYKNRPLNVENLIDIASSFTFVGTGCNGKFEYDDTNGFKRAIVMSSSDGTTQDLRIRTGSAINLVGVQKISADVFISGISNVTSVIIAVLGSSSYSFSTSSSKLKNGWNHIEVLTARSETVSDATWSSSDNFRIYVSGTGAFTVKIASYNLHRIDKGKLIFVDDHGYHEFMTLAYPILKNAGCPVTWAINPGRLGAEITAGSETLSILSQSDIDTLANDPYSEFSFHNWNPSNNPTETMTPDEVRTDIQKCLTYLKQNGICPNHVWRAAWVQNKANNWWVAQDMLEGCACHDATAGYTSWTFENFYNVPRIGVHGRATSGIDAIFDRLRLTHCTVVLYTHGCVEEQYEGNTLHATVAEIEYIADKIADGVDDGWLEPTTFNRLMTMKEHGMYTLSTT